VVPVSTSASVFMKFDVNIVTGGHTILEILIFDDRFSYCLKGRCQYCVVLPTTREKALVMIK
jgi:hypothetical protein